MWVAIYHAAKKGKSYLFISLRHEGKIARLDLVKAHDKLAPGKLRLRLDPKTLPIAKAVRTKQGRPGWTEPRGRDIYRS